MDVNHYSEHDQKDVVIFIDKFFVPTNAQEQFYEIINLNRNFIKKLAGFIEDAHYERWDEKRNLIYFTVAKWENIQAVDKAKEAVEAEYNKRGLNPSAMIEQLDITMDRGIYHETDSTK